MQNTKGRRTRADGLLESRHLAMVTAAAAMHKHNGDVPGGIRELRCGTGLDLLGSALSTQSKSPIGSSTKVQKNSITFMILAVVLLFFRRNLHYDTPGKVLYNFPNE